MLTLAAPFCIFAAMLFKRIPFREDVPEPIRRAFLDPTPTKCTRIAMFREAVARLVLDALGITGLTDDREHNCAVSEARNWFRHDRIVVLEPPELRMSQDMFDLAEVHDYPLVRAAVLAHTPTYMEDE